MLAARWHGRRDIRVDEVADLGEPAPGWVRLRVLACGICGTDLEEYTAGPLFIPLEPHPTSGACAPLTMGHETVGVVSAVGEGVALTPGTRVAVEANLVCHSCFWCRRGDYPLCAGLASLGLMAHGGLAEELLAPAYMCIPYSDDLPTARMVFAEPLSVAVRAARRARMEPGATVGVFGAGTVGLLALQALRVQGAERVVVIEPHAMRRTLAHELGADLAITPAEARLAIDELTSGVGLDATVEAAGTLSAAHDAITLLRRGGRATLLGVHPATLELDILNFLMAEKEVASSLSHSYDVDFPEAVRLLETGQVRVDPLLTERIALADVVERGFEALVAAPEEHLKIVVEPSSEPLVGVAPARAGVTESAAASNS